MLTPPNFLPTNPTVIRQEVITEYERLSGTTLRPSQPESLLVELISYFRVLDSTRANEAAQSNLVAFSSGAILDNLATLVGVRRLGASYARALFRFAFTVGHGGLTLAQGLRVSSTDGVAVFVLQESVYIAPNTLTYDIELIAEQAGIISNNYAVGIVTTILDPAPYLESVTNLNVTAGGSDIETDEALRERIPLALSLPSTAGSEFAYRYHALSVNPAILSVGIFSDLTTPGQVYIYPLMHNGQPTPTQILADVEAALNAERVRPLTDTVIVVQPTRVDFQLIIQLTLYYGADAQIVIDEINANLQDYFLYLRSALGRDVILTQLIAKCQVDGVYRVNILAQGGAPFTDIIINDRDSFAYNTLTNIIIAGFTNG